jgi:hypothetical protein
MANFHKQSSALHLLNFFCFGQSFKSSFLLLIKFWKVSIDQRHVINVKLISNDAVRKYSLLKSRTDSFNIFSWILCVKAEINSFDFGYITGLFPNNLEFFICNVISDYLDWLISEVIIKCFQSLSGESSWIAILINFLFNPPFFNVVIKCAIIEKVQREPWFLCFFDEVNPCLFEELVQVKWCVFFFLSVNGDFSWHSAGKRVIRFHDFWLDSEIEVVILTNFGCDPLKFFECFSFFLLSIMNGFRFFR